MSLPAGCSVPLNATADPDDDRTCDKADGHDSKPQMQ
jgi:hypothetical protein